MTVEPEKDHDWENKPGLEWSAVLGILGVLVICALIWVNAG